VKVCVRSRVACGTPRFRAVAPIDQSCQPWYPHAATRSRPVNARATRTAPDVASEPFFPKRTFSAHGTISTMRSATSISSECGSERITPSSSCAFTAAVTSGSL